LPFQQKPGREHFRLPANSAIDLAPRKPSIVLDFCLVDRQFAVARVQAGVYGTQLVF
jgi:hypothetical protein